MKKKDTPKVIARLNFVAKYAIRFNRAAIMRNKKLDYQRHPKHKGEAE